MPKKNQIAEVEELGRLRALNQELDQRLRERTAELETTRAEVERRQAMVEAILDQLATGVIVADQHGEWLFYNQEAARITGIGAGRIPISEWSGVFGLFEPDGVTQIPVDRLPLVRALGGEVVRDFEMIINNPQLEGPRSITASARPLQDGDSTWGGVVVFEDITQEVRARAALERSNAELSNFAYVASHDLQEPLRKISGFADLLRSEYSDQLQGDAHTYLEFVVDGTVRMRQLIRDLLEYSRVGTAETHKQAVDLQELVGDIESMLSTTIDETGARLIYEDLPPVFADTVQLRQLLQNLIGNSLKFRSEATPQIDIRAERQLGAWQIAVRDNGIGIDPAHHERIFQVFQRLHARTDYPGTGIGLAVCQRIVTRHGGRLWVESSSGEGATFLFTLPDAARKPASS